MIDSKTLYEVTGLEICASGFERLRTSYSEFILVAYPSSRRDGAATLLREWLADIDSCMRPEDFDYDATRRVVRQFVKANGAALRNALRSCEYGDGDEGAEIVARLYIRDNREGAHYPVWGG